eukprot:gene8408-10325_t
MNTSRYSLFLFTISLLVICTSSYPTSPPVQVCGNTPLLSGPATAPPGAIVVPAGSNAGFNFKLPNTTYWFAPGVHYLEHHQYAKVVPGEFSVYIGGPGAILDGNHTNNYAFGEKVNHVTIRYLEIRNFGNDTSGPTNGNEAVVNQDTAFNWTIEYNYIHDNDGMGLFLGTGSITRYNCIKNNGQHGFGTYHPNGTRDILLEYNEIVGNNQDDWENIIPYCGCTGGGKFWDAHGAIVRHNWVHHNHGPGLWVDHNNADFLFENNYINDNDGVGIFYEVSFNFMIRGNTLKRNSVWAGLRRQDNFPEAAIYISESGGEPAAGNVYHQSEIVGNLLEDNWDGVILWENADRFCRKNETFDTTNGCPWFNETWGYRYKTQNINIYNNEFKFNPANVNCTNLANCGRNAVFSNWGSYPANSPYLGRVIQNAITFNQNNKFFNNTYTGTWKFMPFSTENTFQWGTWRNPPYNQDNGSTINGVDPTEVPTDTPTPTVPGNSENHLDVATSTLETGVGQWVEWYSATVASSGNAAHSGTKSLQVTVTNSWSWGVSVNNYPGFVGGPGPKKISVWAKLGSGAGTPNLTVSWFDASSTKLGENAFSFGALTSSWTQLSATATAPTGTSYVYLTLTGAELSGTVFYFDDFVVGDL